MIQVILVDDHDMVRQGLRLLLEEQPDIRVIGDVANGMEALALVEQTKPDVLVVDLMLSDVSGLEVARQVRQRHSTVGIVVLSMHSNTAHVAEAMRSGALAYVIKEAGIRELVTAVHEAAQGRAYLSSQLNRDAIEDYSQRLTSLHVDPFDTLTKREREVLVLVAQGFTSAEIAERWVVSRRTVEAHRSHMISKLGFTSQADVVRFALRRGLLPIEE
jgi:DNA-binding NarL/FixJ family response regulator